MSNNDFEKELRAQIDGLDKEKMPERDLWSGIDIALSKEVQLPEQNSKGKQLRIFAVAASLAFVGIFSWFGIEQSTPKFDGQELVAALSSQHQQQKNALLVKFQDQPALTQNWEKQLLELDEAALAIKAALEQDASNMALLKMLQNVHQQQIELIERVHSSKWQQI